MYELQPSLRSVKDELGLDEWDDGKTKGKQDGEEQYGRRDVVAPNVALEFIVLHQMLDRFFVLVRRDLCRREGENESDSDGSGTAGRGWGE